MNIETYINLTRLVRKKPPISEKQSLLKFFKKCSKVVKGKTLSIIPTYTSNIYPEIFSFLNEPGKSYLIWDQHLIDIFRNNFNNLCLLKVADEKRDDANIQKCINIMKSNLLCFLSWKTSQYPELSYLLANEAQRFNENCTIGVPKNLVSEADSLIHIQKLFLFHHELYHHHYQNEPEEYKEYSKSAYYLIEFLLENLNLDLYYNLAEEIPFIKDVTEICTWKDVENYVCHVLKPENSSLLELICDWYSAVDIYNGLLAISEKNVKRKLTNIEKHRLLNHVYTGVQIAEIFLSTKKQLYETWDRCITVGNYVKKGMKEESREQELDYLRPTLTHFLLMFSIYTMHNLKKISEVPPKDPFEQMIVKYYFPTMLQLKKPQFVTNSLLKAYDLETMKLSHDILEKQRLQLLGWHV